MYPHCTPNKKAFSSIRAKGLKLLARPAGFEPATYGLEVFVIVKYE